MKRSDFIRLLLSLPFGASWLAQKLQSGSYGGQYLLNRFYAAGFQYYEGPALIGYIKPGEKLRLKADSRNYYDKFAVAIYRNDVMLGHVPRSDNKHISRLLRQGVHLYCNVTEVNPERNTWKMLKVVVCL